MARDYQTAGGDGSGVRRADGTVSKDAVLSSRYYLAEADFLVGLEGSDEVLLEQLDAALRSPHWHLYLGRKSFVPSVPVSLPGTGLRDAELEAALEAEPWPLRPYAFADAIHRRPRLRLVLERHSSETNEVRLDQPIGAAYEDRTFGLRYVETRFLPAEE